MNKELYLKTKELEKEYYNNYAIVESLKKFLKENKNKFREKESLMALKEISIFLERKEVENKKLYNELNKVKEKFVLSCKHEVVLQNCYGKSYTCAICQTYVENPQYFIITALDLISNRSLVYKLKEMVDKSLENDINFQSFIEENMRELQYEENIKVYRRSL